MRLDPNLEETEQARLAALRHYAILDTPPEGEFDEVTELAAQVCGTPIALITLVDETRQWFKSRVGFDFTSTPRAHAFCAHTLGSTETLVVSDARRDARFANNPLVTGAPQVRFYAGAPLTTPQGHVLGALCVYDYAPRELTPTQAQTLRTLSRHVMTQLELRRAVRETQASEQRYRLLFEQNPQPMWVYDPANLRILAVNQAAVAHYGYSADEFLTLTLDDIRPSEDVPLLHRELARRRRDLQQAGVWRHKLKDGRVIKAEISSHTISLEGRSAVLVLAIDVTDRLAAEAALVSSNQQYERQRVALVELTRAAVTHSINDTATVRTLTEAVARVLEVERVSVWRFNERRTAIVCDDLFEAGPARHSAGQQLEAQPFPAYFEALAAEEVIAAHDAQRDPRTRDLRAGYLEPLGITSMLDSPVSFNSQLHGVLCVEHRGAPRTWTQGEQSFAISIANLISLILSRRAQAQSEMRIRAIFENEPECVKVVSADGRVLDMNPAGLRAIEAEHLDVIQHRAVLDIIHPDDQPAFLALHRQASGGRPGELQFRLRGLKGTERWMETHATPLPESGEGAPFSVLSVTRDITERRQMEQHLRTSEERFRLLAAATNDASWDWDFTDNTIWWSDGFDQLFGFDANAPKSDYKSWSRRVHPDDLGRVLPRLEKAIRDTTAAWSEEYRFRRKDGTYAYVLDRGSVIRDADGKPLRMVGGMSDLTGRKQVEEKLREQAALLDRASDAILVRDLEGRILYWNKGAERVYGWSADQVVGRLVTELLYRSTELLREGTTSALRQGDWNGEVEHVAADGRLLTIAARWTLVRDAQGEPKSVFCIDTDITERKRLEQQFLRAQRLESIGTLAGGIAHDLNNLLAPVLMGAGLLRQYKPDEQSLEVIRNIEQSARRGAELVKQVLSFARGVDGARVAVSLDQVIREVELIVQNTFPRQIAWESRLAEGLWPVSGDPTQLHQVLLNLCVNARDAMSTGGQLRITAANETVASDLAALHRGVKPGRFVRIDVSDTGSGIRRELLDRIFEPFFTTKEFGQGTGLGLSTALGIVRSHGGFVHVTSEPGRGSVFTVYLPADSGSAAADAPAARTETLPRGSGELILVVEDEAPVRQVTRQTLELFGYRVLTADDGAQALAVFMQQRAQIAAVITDMMMPVMDGPALIAALLRLEPGIRILAASGMNTNGQFSRAPAAGVQHFLSKPYSAEALLGAVQALLAAPAGSMPSPHSSPVS